jgi:hypothetical protein
MESFFRIELSLSWGCRGGGLIGFTLVPYDRHGPDHISRRIISCTSDNLPYGIN